MSSVRTLHMKGKRKRETGCDSHSMRYVGTLGNRSLGGKTDAREELACSRYSHTAHTDKFVAYPTFHIFKSPIFLWGFCGADGTRTRGLLRDRQEL